MWLEGFAFGCKSVFLSVNEGAAKLEFRASCAGRLKVAAHVGFASLAHGGKIVYTHTMPSINDIMSVAEALEKSPVVVVRDNCVAVRNRNAACRRCVDACPADAIDVCGNELTLHTSLCNSCGACTVACPTEALVSVAPTSTSMLQSATAALEVAGNRAVFACARIASKHLADPASFTEVPCLSRVDETTMLSLAVLGAERVLLVDGDCSTCKYRDCAVHADVAVAFARELLDAQGCAVPVERTTGFPDDLKIQDTGGMFGTTRRGFFSEAVGAAKETAMTAARTTMAQELGLDVGEVGLGERLRVTESGTLPLIRSPRHEAAINALDALGQSQVEFIDSRLFGSVTIDTQRCNSCNMCSVFCPTGALKRDEADSLGAPLRYLEFSACECVQCGLCVDVCWKGALTLSSQVNTDQLFDFEPVTFHLSSANARKNSVFGKNW